MSQPLLTSKFYIHPVRQDTVKRIRLINQLNAGLGKKLSLISAPAGFGKTTLLCEWIREIQELNSNDKHTFYHVAWLSLDKSDNDPYRFLSYLIIALQKNIPEPSFGQTALKLLKSHELLPYETIVAGILNEISKLQNKILLIMDDYHCIENEIIHNILSFIIRNMGPELHIAISTRCDPPFPLARLRAQNAITELRALDLSFRINETSEFLNRKMHLNLGDDDISALFDRTEGWIAGLQLAALSMQGLNDPAAFVACFSGSHRFVMDYLLEEILNRQTDKIKMFLLKTSILKQLSGPLCDAVSGDTGSQHTLELLENANLFIVPLNNERQWYRYHHLFADLLRQQMEVKHAKLVIDLHKKASHWLYSNGFINDAIDHILLTNDYQQAVSMLEDHIDDIWTLGEHRKLQTWLARIPVSLLHSNPLLSVYLAWFYFTNGEQEKAEQCLRAAENSIGKKIDRSPDSVNLSVREKAGIQGKIATLRAFLASHRGDVSTIIRYAQSALELLPENDLVWQSGAAVALGDAFALRGEISAAYEARLKALETSTLSENIFLNLVINLKIAINLREQGELLQTVELCEQQIKYAEDIGIVQTGIVGGIFSLLGETFAEMNRLDKAMEYAHKGVALSKIGTDVTILIWSYMCLVRVFLSTQDIGTAETVLSEMKDLIKKHYVPPAIKTLVDIWQGKIWLLQNKQKHLMQWLSVQNLPVHEPIEFSREPEYLLKTRILMVQGHYGKAESILQILKESSEKSGRCTRLIEILILQAVLKDKQGETEGALDVLHQVLKIAEPRKFIRAFIDEGPVIAGLLYRAAQNSKNKYARELLNFIPIAEPAQNKDNKPFEALSEREVEILRLLSRGLSNQDIGNKLYISAHTVKTHTRNIYTKLDVHNRMEAVAKARAFNIIQ